MDESTINKPSLLTFGQYRIGGVQTFYKLLFAGNDNKEFNCEIIFFDKRNELTPTLTEPWIESAFQVFKYNPEKEEEFIYRNKLAQKLGNFKGVIVTNFSLELKSITKEVFQRNTIFHISHDDDYIPIAETYQDRIDAFICHNPIFLNILKDHLPERANDIYYIPYGIIPSDKKVITTNSTLKLVYFSRFDETKGIQNIPILDELLKAKGIEVNWVLMGDGPLKEKTIDLINGIPNFEYFKPKNSKEIYNQLEKCDLFILPSYKDGLPIAMLESMSAGLVPIVFSFNDGINDIIGDAGFVVKSDDLEDMANKINILNNDRTLLNNLKCKARKLVLSNYHYKTNSAKYFKLFSEYKALKKEFLREKIDYNVLQKQFKIGLFDRLKSLIQTR
jgi:glycosyltransferase involved in cell wall biosynthesis